MRASYSLKKELDDTAITVTELTDKISRAIEDKFPLPVYVTGEISNMKIYRSGHLYFTLKDEESSIKCVMFRNYVNNLKFEPEDGLEVIVNGNVRVYSKYGYYQIYVENINPKGIGALQLRFEQLKKKLLKEGLFDEGKKRPIPVSPQNRVAIITSRDGAALHDITDTILKRFPHANITLLPVKVQGVDSATQISEAIKLINDRLSGSIDVIIVGRGGGSIEDLWSFNEEEVVRAIAGSKIPVISAVGHETDFTLSDFAADMRAKTPTEAGTLVYPDYNELTKYLKGLLQQTDNYVTTLIKHNKTSLTKYCGSLRIPKKELVAAVSLLNNFQKRLNESLENFIALKRERLNNFSSHYMIRDPGNILRNERDRLLMLLKHSSFEIFVNRFQSHVESIDNKNSIIDSLINQLIKDKTKDITSLGRELNAKNPLAILERGYSVTKHKGKILKDSREVKTGDDVEVTLHKGKFDAKIHRIKEK